MPPDHWRPPFLTDQLTSEVSVAESRNPTPDPPRPAGDDLQKIAGIGGAVAARLTDAGVATYGHLASHTPQRLAALTRVPSGKIVSQDWIGQARRLADSVLAEPEGQQKYATFHVELLIDADNTVRRTKTRHYQTDTEDSWPGWDDQRLIAVIRRKAALDTPARPTAGPPPPARPEPPAPPAPTAPPVHADGPAPAEEGTHGSFRLAGQPTAVRMTLRVGHGLDAGDVDYTAEVAARSLADGHRHPLVPASGTAVMNEPVALELAGPPLRPGIYRLEARVVIYGHRHQPGDSPLGRSHILGDLVHVAPPRPPATGRPARHPTAANGRKVPIR
ncbi:MAG TPA: hypothetical protein VH307_31480 [Streptosporangiaceae bacterium]|nr:hypothetical protein [Streptosporangiaceae bacterium]